MRGDRKKDEIHSFLNFGMRIMGKFYYMIFKQPLLRVVKHPESEHALLRFVKQSRGTQPLLRVVDPP